MNTVQAGNAEVYTSNIYVYADEYESSLKDTDELYKQNSSQFTDVYKRQAHCLQLRWQLRHSRLSML